MIKLGKTSPPAPPAASPAQPAPLAAPAQTGASLASQLMVPGNVAEILKECGKSAWLPQAKLQYINNLEGNAGKVTIGFGDNMVVLGADWIITCLGMRHGAFQKRKNAKGELEYAQAYQGGQSNARYDAFKQAAANPDEKIFMGLEFLVAVLVGDKASICFYSLDSKSQVNYWAKPFAAAQAKHQTGAKITVENHLPNINAKKADQKFYDGKKFNDGKQWVPVELTQDQMATVAAALSVVQEQVAGWQTK